MKSGSSPQQLLPYSPYLSHSPLPSPSSLPKLARYAANLDASNRLCIPSSLSPQLYLL